MPARRCPLRPLAVVIPALLACSGIAPVEPGDLPPPPAPDAAVPTPPEPPEPTADEGALPPLDLAGPRDPECRASPWNDSEPLLAARQPGGSTPAVERHPNGIAETLTMGNGSVVRVIRSGCVHAGEVWQLAPPPKGPPTAAARKLLQKVALSGTPALQACVAAAPDPLPEEGFQAGEAWCRFQSHDTYLEWVFDFAL